MKTKHDLKIIVKLLLMGFVQKTKLLPLVFMEVKTINARHSFLIIAKYYSEYLYIYIFKKRNVCLIHFRSLELGVGYFFLGIYQTGQGVFG
jgi:hypothetical protein